MITTRELERNLRLIEHRLEDSCKTAERSPESVRLIAATKTQPTSLLRDLYDLGLRDFGENRVQDLLKRREELPTDIRWHFIGHLQSNKSRQIAGFAEMVHSIDSFETARELSKRAAQHARRIAILIEVNISGEETKHGVETGDAGILASQIAEECPNLIVAGLMGMASYEEDVERTRGQFATLRELLEAIQERHPELNAFRELSMGMSHDFEVAIEEGATMIRIGSALFGERTY